MRLIVGLGNPGSEHALNRHNVGFMSVDVISQFYKSTGYKNKHQGLIADCMIDGQKIMLLKPLTYMNLSGNCVASVCNFFKIAVEDTVVVYDDIDLKLGQIKAKQGGGHGGHNGLKSIDSHMGPNYWRIRIGVGHPGDRSRVSGYVLGNFSPPEKEIIDELLDSVALHLPCMLKTDSGKFLNFIAKDR